ncbi:hypothetical protein FRC12_002984 [Ceratobasidium sp. 428]|nr:hypothetical protein FRC12_002984 [Ceratobasidium sp. 428]
MPPKLPIIEWTTSDAPLVPHRPHEYSQVPNPDTNGDVDWMEALEPGHKTHDMWCNKIGEYIASEHLGEKRSFEYCMDGLPEGYALFRHHKTSPELKQKRGDVYLYGVDHKFRFRSPDEFYLHALWLMRGARKRDECGCKWHIGGGSQIDINRRNRLPGRKRHSEKNRRKSAP